MVSSIEDIIEATGGMGKFQIILILVMSAKVSLGNWSMVHMVFAGIIPDWYCVIEDLNLGFPVNVTDATNATNYQTCDVNGTQCDVYQFEGGINTVINEWGLICDLKYVKATLISVQMGGVLAGAVLGGYLGDQLGRKKSTYLFVLENIAANLIAAFSISWPMFAALRFFCGFGVGGLFVITIPYPLEFMPIKWRSILGVLPTWIVGTSCFVLAAYLLKDWSHIHITCAILFVPTLIGWFLITESGRWLAVHNRVDEAMEVFHTIARKNGRDLPPGTRKVLEEIARNEMELRATQATYTYLDLVKTWQMAKPTFIICSNWACLALVYYGIGFAVSSFPGDFYVNTLLMTVLDLPFTPVTLIMMNKIGRKPTAILQLFVCGAASIGCLVVELKASEESRGLWLRVLGMTARVAITSAWCAVFTMGGEIYPTVIRNLASGAFNSSARIGSILAPFLINLDTKSGAIVAYIVIAGLSFSVGGSCFFLSETSGVVLPDSMTSHHEQVKGQQQEMKDVAEVGSYENGGFSEEKIDIAVISKS